MRSVLIAVLVCLALVAVCQGAGELYGIRAYTTEENQTFVKIDEQNGKEERVGKHYFGGNQFGFAPSAGIHKDRFYTLMSDDYTNTIHFVAVNLRDGSLAIDRPLPYENSGIPGFIQTIHVEGNTGDVITIGQLQHTEMAGILKVDAATGNGVSVGNIQLPGAALTAYDPRGLLWIQVQSATNPSDSFKLGWSISQKRLVYNVTTVDLSFYSMSYDSKTDSLLGVIKQGAQYQIAQFDVASNKTTLGAKVTLPSPYVPQPASAFNEEGRTLYLKVRNWTISHIAKINVDTGAVVILKTSPPIYSFAAQK